LQLPASLRSAPTTAAMAWVSRARWEWASWSTSAAASTAVSPLSRATAVRATATNASDSRIPSGAVSLALAIPAEAQAVATAEDGDHAALLVDDQLAVAVPGRLEVAAGRLAAPAQDRLAAQDQLARAERLGDVVVGAHLQAADPVFLAGLGGEHDDGNAAAGA